MLGQLGQKVHLLTLVVSLAPPTIPWAFALVRLTILSVLRLNFAIDFFMAIRFFCCLVAYFIKSLWRFDFSVLLFVLLVAD